MAAIGGLSGEGLLLGGEVPAGLAVGGPVPPGGELVGTLAQVDRQQDRGERGRGARGDGNLPGSAQDEEWGGAQTTPGGYLSRGSS